MSCVRARQLLDAWIDGELDPATAGEIGRHIAACPACATLRTERETLITEIRTGAPRYAAPPALTQAIRSGLRMRAAETPNGALRRAGPTWLQAVALSGIATAMAVLATVWLLRIAPEDAEREQAVSRHVAVLSAALANPASLVEVASTDRHEVKPWFEGRIDFSPPVRDLVAQGFRLVGGRVDHSGNARGAALVYRIRAHTVELFVSRSGTSATEAPRMSTVRGFGVITWTEGGMRFAAVSDVDAKDLQRFVEAVRSPS